MSDNLDWLDEVMGHMMDTASTPAADGGAEDLDTPPAPPPGPRTTAELLPYGTAYQFSTDESPATMERLAGPTVHLASGRVGVADPLTDPVEVVLVGQLAGGEVATEVGLIAVADPGSDGPRQRVCTVAVGDVAAVEEWQPVVIAGQQRYLVVDAGTGSLVDPDAAGQLTGEAARAEEMLRDVWASGVVPLPAEGRAVGIAFDCGMGDGAYPVYAGFDAFGGVAAFAVDLELHHHGTVVG